MTQTGLTLLSCSGIIGVCHHACDNFYLSVTEIVPNQVMDDFLIARYRDFIMFFRIVLHFCDI